jgi:hypothetical protein
MQLALRPYDPVDATERRRDEQDLAWLRRGVCGVTAPKRSWRRHWLICRCWGQMADVVTDYRGWSWRLRQRIVELGTHMEVVDAAAGLPARYCSKLLSQNNKTSLGRISLGPLLGALP